MLEEIIKLWRGWRKGGTHQCPACADARVTLAVAEWAYRWRCVPCGWRSSWFVVIEKRLHVLGTDNSAAAADCAASPR
jgi:hypothetical protein